MAAIAVSLRALAFTEFALVSFRPAQQAERTQEPTG